jgi:hypothetical protein
VNETKIPHSTARGAREPSVARFHNYKSTTTPERYYHFNTPGEVRGTVFMRHDYILNKWGVTVALCHEKDAFNKRIGRNTARRRFFTFGPMFLSDEASYDAALLILDDARHWAAASK